MRHYLPRLSILALLLPSACGTHNNDNSLAEQPAATTKAQLVTADAGVTGSITLQFPLTGPTSLGNINSSSRRFAVLTIAGTKYYRTPLELRRVTLGGASEVWQAAVELAAGTHELTELFVTDESISTMAAVPLAGSDLAGAVLVPLPQLLAVRPDQSTVFLPDTIAFDGYYEAFDFGYDEFPDVVINENPITPYYKGSVQRPINCLGRVAMSVLVCDELCENDSSFKDTCDLFAVYRGTQKYEKLCPRWASETTTPKRTADRSAYCEGTSPIVAVPLGHSQYRITAKKRGYQDATRHFSAAEVSDWHPGGKAELAELTRIAAPALSLGYELRSDAGVELQDVAYDGDGYLGEPTHYDPATGAYAIGDVPLSAIDFGDVQYGDGVTRKLIVRNVGRRPLQLSDLRVDSESAPTADNPGFTLESGSTLTIAAGAQEEIAIKFQFNKGDAESQTLRAKLHVRHNDAYIATVTGQAEPEADIELIAKVVSRCSPICDDRNVCTTNRCQPDVGCVFPAVTTPTQCDDGNSCSLNDSCLQGVCQSKEGLDVKAQVEFRSNPSAYMLAEFCEWGNCGQKCITKDYPADPHSVTVSPVYSILTYDVSNGSFVPHTENYVDVTYNYINRNIPSTYPGNAIWRLCSTSIQQYQFSYTVLTGAPYVEVNQINGYVRSDLEGYYGERVHATFQVRPVDGFHPTCGGTF